MTIVVTLSATVPLCYISWNAVRLLAITTATMMSDTEYLRAGTATLTQAVSARPLVFEQWSQMPIPEYWDPLAVRARSRVSRVFPGVGGTTVWGFVAWGLLYVLVLVLSVGVAVRRYPAYSSDLSPVVRREAIVRGVGSGVRWSVGRVALAMLCASGLRAMTDIWAGWFVVWWYFQGWSSLPAYDIISKLERATPLVGAVAVGVLLPYAVYSSVRNTIRIRLPVSAVRCSVCNYPVGLVLRCPECGAPAPIHEAAPGGLASTRRKRGAWFVRVCVMFFVLPVISFLITGHPDEIARRLLPSRRITDERLPTLRIPVGRGCILGSARGLTRTLIWCDPIESSSSLGYSQPIAALRIVTVASTGVCVVNEIDRNGIRSRSLSVIQSGGVVLNGGSIIWMGLVHSNAFVSQDPLMMDKVIGIRYDTDWPVASFTRVNSLGDAGVLGDVVRALDWSKFDIVSEHFGINQSPVLVDMKTLNVDSTP